jgi:hypothetical protein
LKEGFGSVTLRDTNSARRRTQLDRVQRRGRERDATDVLVSPARRRALATIGQTARTPASGVCCGSRNVGQMLEENVGADAYEQQPAKNFSPTLVYFA